MFKIQITKAQSIIILTSLLVLAVFCVSAISRYLCVKKSSYYLQEAKKESNPSKRIRGLELATLLDSSETNRTLTGIEASAYGDPALAIRYLAGIKTPEAYCALGEAYYNRGDHAKALYYSLKNEKVDSLCLATAIRANLKQGNLQEARRLSSSSPNKGTVTLDSLSRLLNLEGEIGRVSQFNDLNTGGFPQAAFALLLTGKEQGLLVRDELLVLAQAQKDKGDEAAAFSTAEEALTKDAYYPQTYRQLISYAQDLAEESEATGYKNRLARITW